MIATQAHDGGSPEQSDDRPSKTQRKKAMHDLQDLGEAVAGLSDARLASLLEAGHLDEPLAQAIHEYRRTRSHEGRRRQRQYIGKLMRRLDADPLREAVAAAQLGTARDSLALHQAEHWRDAMIAGDDAVTRFIAEYPNCDAQPLRQAVRSARRDSADVGERHGRAFRDLFRLIRDVMNQNPESSDG